MINGAQADLPTLVRKYTEQIDALHNDLLKLQIYIKDNKEQIRKLMERIENLEKGKE